jgi:methyl coenzyme M reductase beta subunit
VVCLVRGLPQEHFIDFRYSYHAGHGIAFFSHTGIAGGLRFIINKNHIPLERVIGFSFHGNADTALQNIDKFQKLMPMEVKIVKSIILEKKGKKQFPGLS